MSATGKARHFIRPVHTDDTPAINRIRLLTADAGQSAESLHHLPELPVLQYIDPFVKLCPTFGFVLVSSTTKPQEEVLGYLLGTPDTRRHEAVTEEKCYLPLRLKYPNNPYPVEATSRDQVIIDYIHKPPVRPQHLVDMAPAHIHIAILPQAQRQGWGVELVDHAVEHLKQLGQSGLFLGIDSRNHNARAFYLNTGFKPIPNPGKEYFYLDFSDWKGPKRIS
ncbi:acyl-CoA N-acyltransferase, partial [Ceratobasidium sp. AG-I]